MRFAISRASVVREPTWLVTWEKNIQKIEAER
jgi:hypothetical protein